MTDLCITTTNTTDRDNAADKIWYNRIMEIANNTEKCVGDGSTHYFLSELEAMTEEQVTPLKIYGKKEGILQYESGLTTALIKFAECDNTPGKYWAYKPDASLMTGVANMTEEQHDDAWVPDPEA